MIRNSACFLQLTIQLVYTFVPSTNLMTKKLFIIITMICAPFFSKAQQTDTAFIRYVNWTTLNANVSYYRLKNEKTSRPVELKPLYIYYPRTQQYEAIKNTQPLAITPAELKELTLSDYFSKAKGEYLLKINSKIYYKTMPSLLAKISVRPKQMDEKSMGSLMNKLKKEPFVERITIQRFPTNNLNTLMHQDQKTVVILVKLKPAYRNLKSVKSICGQLKQQPDVADAVFFDWLDTPSDTETIYLLSHKF